MSDKVTDAIERSAQALGLSVERFREEAHLGEPKTATLEKAVAVIRDGCAGRRCAPDQYLEVLRHELKRYEVRSDQDAAAVA